MKRFILAFFFVPLVVFALEPSNVQLSVLEAYRDHEQIPDWAQRPIEVLTEKGILTGDIESNFAPAREINRAEFAKLVVEASQVKKYTPLTPSFTDVQPTDWFYTFVETAKREGWIDGYPDGLFRPGAEINRAEIAKILTLAFGFSPSVSYDDRYWYDPYVRALAERRLLPFSTQQATFIPAKRPDRAEVSEHIYKVMAYTGKLNSDEFDVAYLNGGPVDPTPVKTVTELEIQQENSAEEEEIEEENSLANREIIDYTPEKTEEVEFEYHDPNALEQKVETSAGKLYINKASHAAKKLNVFGGQDNVELLPLVFQAKEGPVKINALQFRFSGNKGPGLYRRVWLSINGQVFSPRVAPTEVTTVPLNTSLTLRDQSLNIRLVGEVNEEVSSGDRARAVLFLPEWIASNTERKIGFFPFGGADVTVSN